jgi:uncharacterized protein (UPF0371 family)
MLQNAVTQNTNGTKTYTETCLKLLHQFSANFGKEAVAAVVITRINQNSTLEEFKPFEKTILQHFPHLQVHYHRAIEGYPHDIVKVREGFANNSRIQIPETCRLVIMTGVEANSGKLGTCLSQLFHEKDSVYSKLELFPIWNLSIAHPVNLAYEAATADIGDYVMEDTFEKGAAVNYNRDIEAFPVLRNLMEGLLEDRSLLDSLYRSPTAMGINVAGNCIVDEALCNKCAKQEIVRRFFVYRNDSIAQERCAGLMKRLEIEASAIFPGLKAEADSVQLFEKDEIFFVDDSESTMTSCARLIARVVGKEITSYDWISVKFEGEEAAEVNAIEVCSKLESKDLVRLIGANFLVSQCSKEEKGYIVRKLGANVIFK